MTTGSRAATVGTPSEDTRPSDEDRVFANGGDDSIRVDDGDDDDLANGGGGTDDCAADSGDEVENCE